MGRLNHRCPMPGAPVEPVYLCYRHTLTGNLIQTWFAVLFRSQPLSEIIIRCSEAKMDYYCYNWYYTEQLCFCMAKVSYNHGSDMCLQDSAYITWRRLQAIFTVTTVVSWYMGTIGQQLACCFMSSTSTIHRYVYIYTCNIHKHDNNSESSQQISAVATVLAESWTIWVSAHPQWPEGTVPDRLLGLDLYIYIYGMVVSNYSCWLAILDRPLLFLLPITSCDSVLTSGHALWVALAICMSLVLDLAQSMYEWWVVMWHC